MKKVGVIGHFGFGKEMLNGQTIKTKNVTIELEKQFGTDQVIKVDTHRGEHSLLRAFIQMIKCFKCSENIVILPAHNGIRLLAPLCSVLNLVFRRRIHYVVIGGWLNSLLEAHKVLTRTLRSFTGIYVETSIMKTALEKRGFMNAYIMRNFKDIRILRKDELVYQKEKPYRLCIFSRVMKEKGIADAIRAVSTVNEMIGNEVFSLDIYGPVDEEQTRWFDALKNGFPKCVRYCGVIRSDKSVDVIKNYFALLFPTRFYTEGIPGTIIDAYSAGVPVVSAKWESFCDMVDDGKTGFGYDFDNLNALEDVLIKIAHNPKALLDMKSSCSEKAKSYMPETAIVTMTEKFEAEV